MLKEVILWKSKNKTEAIAQWKDLGRRSWRWVLRASFSSIGFYHEVAFIDGENPNDWRSFDWYDICVTKYFHLGTHHDYYDGPIHTFSIGFIHINWRPWNCKKCISE